MHHLVYSLAGHLRLAGCIGGSTTVAASIVVATLGALDPQGTATELLAVESFDHGVSQLRIVHVGEAETAACTGFTIENRLEPNPFSHRLEQSHQLLFFKGLRQVADVQADAHEGKEMRSVGV